MQLSKSNNGLMVKSVIVIIFAWIPLQWMNSQKCDDEW